jgi:hypothetical protein
MPRQITVPTAVLRQRRTAAGNSRQSPMDSRERILPALSLRACLCRRTMVAVRSTLATRIIRHTGQVDKACTARRQEILHHKIIKSAARHGSRDVRINLDIHRVRLLGFLPSLALLTETSYRALICLSWVLLLLQATILVFSSARCIEFCCLAPSFPAKLSSRTCFIAETYPHSTRRTRFIHARTIRTYELASRTRARHHAFAVFDVRHTILLREGMQESVGLSI